MKAPIRVDQYDCPDCYRKMVCYHQKNRQELRVTCHNCRKEYHFKLIEQLGCYQWSVPAKSILPVEYNLPQRTEPIGPYEGPETENVVCSEPVKRGPGRPRKNPEVE